MSESASTSTTHGFPADEPTPRSSTIFSNNLAAPEDATVQTRSPLSSELERELERDRYGWDEPQDPPGLTAGNSAIPSTTTTVLQSSVPPEVADTEKPISWDGPSDPQNPYNWSFRLRWFYTIISILMALNVTFASSAPTVTIISLQHEFHVSLEVTELTISLFLVGYIFGPLFWGPGSEVIGRRPIFIGSLFAYTLFHLGQALATNIETFLITRFLGGFFAAAPLTNAPGLIADLWDAHERGLPVSLFTLCVFLGPVIGPIVSSFIVSNGVSWRWVYWVMMIFAGVSSVIAALTLPETFAPVILRKKARRLRKADPVANAHVFASLEREDWSLRGVLHRTLYRPIIMLAKEPILVLVTIYLSLVYGVLYALFSAFPIIWIQTRQFTIWQSSLIFIGVGIGATLGSVINSYSTRHYPALTKKWRGFPPPEERLYGAMIGGPLLVIGAFWLGWTGHYASVPWYVPALATIPIGIGISVIFMSFISYLVDAYLLFAASAVAANTMVRSAVAAAFPLFTVQMFQKLGINWACTLIGFIALILSPSAFLFYRYGPKIREKSKFAPCLDLKIAKEIKEAEMSKEKAIV
ncbi:MFS polyamine transporter [Flagelloscypha sp. PMI_526]|nr:MFS polyamine transporter [Flagelloscypha sp. PMI_526]